MRTIEFDQNGIHIGPLRVPEPILCGETWYEITEFRNAKEGENILIEDSIVESGETIEPCWIATLIPRATPEQLQEIGMRERDNRPVLVADDDEIYEEGNEVWDNGRQLICGDPGCSCRRFTWRYRWVLVPV